MKELSRTEKIESLEEAMSFIKCHQGKFELCYNLKSIRDELRHEDAVEDFGGFVKIPRVKTACGVENWAVPVECWARIYREAIYEYLKNEGVKRNSAEFDNAVDFITDKMEEMGIEL